MLSKYRAVRSKYKVLLPLIVSKYVFKRSLYSPETKFIILSRSRTGSTMLINYLKKVPDSYVQSEIMGRKLLIPFWERIPDLIFGKHKKKYQIAGFKYFYYHPIDDQDANGYIYEYVFSHPDILVIHWMREDLFAVVLSRYIALKTGKWAKTRKSINLSSFTISPKGFEYELEKTITAINMTRSLFKDYKNYFELTYEDVTERGRLCELFDFLGVEECDIQHDFKSNQKSETRYKYIKNIKELEDIYNKRIERI